MGGVINVFGYEWLEKTGTGISLKKLWSLLELYFILSRYELHLMREEKRKSYDGYIGRSRFEYEFHGGKSQSGQAEWETGNQVGEEVSISILKGFFFLNS